MFGEPSEIFLFLKQLRKFVAISSQREEEIKKEEEETVIHQILQYEWLIRSFMEMLNVILCVSGRCRRRKMAGTCF